MTVNISGTQINIANDNAIINVTQKNEISENDLDAIIHKITENLFSLKSDDVDRIIRVLEQVRKEMHKSEPEKSSLQNCIKTIAPMITVANGIPTLTDNLQKLYNLMVQYMGNL